MKWSNPRKGVAPSPTPRVTLDYGRQQPFQQTETWRFQLTTIALQIDCLIKIQLLRKDDILHLPTNIHRSFLSKCVNLVLLQTVFSQDHNLCLLYWILLLLLLLLLFENFSHQYEVMIFDWSLSDSKSPQISRTLLNILADPINVLVWTFFICPLISQSYSPFTNRLGIILSVQITISITVTFMFHSFFNSPVRSRYLSLFSPSLKSTL